ncbi:Gfo/Idh/MocA family oxidoreductase [Phenylobacterium sp.]|uniref:Gfo/Idh/MocA family protein n=1 Tax=Phenylobacterium sp. TaxID=1871053 RepID=UPI00286CA752|nr:Gfo/Idh/MocA family oxidoreductase [Phenylobacterium sp.]
MSSGNGEPLRIGILGAARIAPPALISPARATGAAQVVAVAARDQTRATAYAIEHAIPIALNSYEDLIDHPEVDAIYNALPPSRHADLTLAALAAGKPVLCEKPFAMNESEARTMVEAAQAQGLVLMEAFHYRYHPLFARVLEICASGEIGAVRRMEAVFTTSIPDTGAELRYDPALGGGALMDLGTYCLHWSRTVAGAEPLAARAESVLSASGVDVSTHAILAFPGGVIAELTCDMAGPVRASLEITGLEGRLKVINPLAPQLGHLIEVVREGGTSRRETASREPTYDFQLRAFVAAVRGEAAPLTGGADAVAQMAAIDAIKAAIAA